MLVKLLLVRCVGETLLWVQVVCSWASLLAQLVKNPPAIWETWVRCLGWKDPLEKGKGTHSSILAWRIPWTTVHRTAKTDTTEQLSLSLHLLLMILQLCHLPPPLLPPVSKLFSPVHSMPAPICQLLYSTTVLFKVLSWKCLLFLFVFDMLFMWEVL